MILPVDVPGLLQERLRSMRRPPDGLLHPSGDLVGSLRHAQLRAAGAPTRPTELADDVVLMTGTMWHEFAHAALVDAGHPVMIEVKLTPWLPEGWAGTADWVFFDPDRGAFVLGDKKTIKGDGLQWVERDGVKAEHLWQLSAYWHALYDMGLPLVKGFGVLYWPKDRGTRLDTLPRPLVQDCEPLPRETVFGEMESRWAATKTYLDAVYPSVRIGHESPDYLNEFLAPEQERVQKVSWSKPTSTFDLKLVPHWTARYCPFPPELCGCGEQGVTKIGAFDLDGDYRPRKGYESIEPTTRPDAKDLNRRRRSIADD